MMNKSVSKYYSFGTFLSENELCQSWSAINLDTDQTCFVKISSNNSSIDPKTIKTILRKSYDCQSQIRSSKILLARSKHIENKRIIIEYPYLDDNRWVQLSPEIFWRYFPGSLIQICQIVDYLHLLNLVHCDLKLENFQIDLRSTNHNIILIDLDFLISADAHPQRQIFGTPKHIPPEIILNEIIKIQSDNYSLGISVERYLKNKFAPSNTAIKSKLIDFTKALTVPDWISRPSILVNALFDRKIITKSIHEKSLKSLLAMQLLNTYRISKHNNLNLNHFVIEKHRVFGINSEILDDIESTFKTSRLSAFHKFVSLFIKTELQRIGDFWLISIPDDLATCFFDINVHPIFDPCSSKPEKSINLINEHLGKIIKYKDNNKPYIAYLTLISFLEEVKSLKAKSLDDTFKQIYWELGNLSKIILRLENAILLYQKALKFTPKQSSDYLPLKSDLIDVLIQAGQYNLAADTIRKSIVESKNQNDDAYLFKFNRNWTWLLISKGNFNDAEKLLSELMAKAEAKKDIDEIWKLYVIYGVYYSKLSDINAAEKSFRKAITYVSELNNPTYLLTPISNLCLLYIELGQYDKASVYAKQTIKNIEHTSDAYRLSRTYVNLMICQVRLANYQKAEYWLGRYLFGKSQKYDKTHFGRYYFSKGFLEMNKGDIKVAEESFFSALKLLDTDRDKGVIYQNLSWLGIYSGDFDKARKYSLKSKNIYNTISDQQHLLDNELINLAIEIHYNKLDKSEELLTLFDRLQKSNSGYSSALCLFYLLIYYCEFIKGNCSIHSNFIKLLNKSRVPIFETDSILLDSLNESKDNTISINGLKKAYKILYDSGHYFYALLVCHKIAQIYSIISLQRQARKYLGEALRIAKSLKNEYYIRFFTKEIDSIAFFDQRKITRLYYDISDIFKSFDDYNTALEKLLEFSINETGAERGALLLSKPNSPKLQLIASQNCDGESLNDIVDFSSNIPQNVINNLEPLLISNALRDDRTKGYKSIILHNILSVICVPIQVKDHLKGVLYLDHHTIPSVFEEVDFIYIKTISNFISLFLSTITEYKNLLTTANLLTEELAKLGARTKPITQNAVMLEMLNQIPLIAQSEASVLILGESGTGKELLCEMIHDLSGRSKGPLYKLNCAAIQSSMIESELFGVAKRAATDVDERIGKFQAADGGTLFLDEIGDLPLNIQKKMLRVVEYQKFERVGSHITQYIDIRFIYATNKDLKKLIEKGKFREDLYHRINTVVIEIPPLRERPDDIELLLKHFAKRFSSHIRPAPIFKSDTIRVFMNYSWPGNVRELKNIVERYCILFSGKDVLPKDLPSAFLDVSQQSKANTKISMTIEKSKILSFLKANHWNKSQTARELNIPLTTLRRKIKKYKL